MQVLSTDEFLLLSDVTGSGHDQYNNGNRERCKWTFLCYSCTVLCDDCWRPSILFCEIFFWVPPGKFLYKTLKDATITQTFSQLIIKLVCVVK